MLCLLAARPPFHGAMLLLCVYALITVSPSHAISRGICCLPSPSPLQFGGFLGRDLGSVGRKAYGVEGGEAFFHMNENKGFPPLCINLGGGSRVARAFQKKKKLLLEKGFMFCVRVWVC